MKFSVGLLSWKRPLNIKHIVDEYLLYDELIDEIIIWNNNPEEFIEFNGEEYDIVKVINVKSNEDFGLITRFNMGSLSKNQMIMLHDDDLVFPEESLIALRDSWMKETDCFHTFFGRSPKPDGTYSQKVGEGKAEICGRCYVIDRKLCGLVLSEYWKLNPDERKLIHSKGDDILASYVLTHYTGKLHTVLPVPYEKLDDSYALSFGESRPQRPVHTPQLEKEMKEWYNYRTEMMQFCKKRYENGNE
jgi:hypothetical protein